MTISDFDGSRFWPAIKQFVIDMGVEPISIGEPEDETWPKIFEAMAINGTPLSFGMGPGEIMRALNTALAQGGVVGEPETDPMLYYADFANDNYTRSEAPSTRIAMLSVVQPATTLADKLDGSWQTFAANTPRVTDKGLMLEGEKTNLFRDSTFSGAASSGTAFGTYLTVVATGGTRLIKGKGTAHGLPYIEIQFTSAGAGNFSIRDTLVPLVAAVSGDLVVASMAFEMVAGSAANISLFNLQAIGLNGSNVQSEISEASYLSDLTLNNFVRRSRPRTLNGGTTAGARLGLGLIFTGAIDITIRFYILQFEKGSLTASSPILTSGAAATRAADAVTLKLPAGTTHDVNVTFDDGSGFIADDVPGGDYVLSIASFSRPLVTFIDWRYLSLNTIITASAFGMMPQKPLAGDTNYTPTHFELGYKSVRFEDIGVKFGQLTSAIGVYDPTVLARFDTLVAMYDAQGIRPYIELGGQFGGVLPSDAYWAEYVSLISSRYGNRIDYGLGNEHDMGPYFPGTWTDSFRFCSIASPIIRANAPNSKIYSPSVTANGTSYLDAFFAQGGGALVDCIGFHPYVQPLRPERMLSVVLAFKTVMKKYGFEAKPLLCTEVGWHQYFLNDVLTNPFPYTLDPSDVPMPGSLAAAYIHRIHLNLFAGGVAGNWHFTLDNSGFTMVPLVRMNDPNQLDIAGIAYQNLVRRLGNSRLLRYRVSPSQNLLHYIEYFKGGKRWRAMWRIDNQEGAVDLSGYTAGYDVLGASITLSSSYNLTMSPIYVRV